MKEKPPRRTQAERTAATRRVLLDAAIQCLFEHGYGATTTIMVAAKAKVSRGAMLHQFPSKADLMVFVVEAVFEQEVALYGDLLAGIDDPLERFIAYPDAVWKVLSRPAGVAVLEILQGSRSDPALSAKLAPVNARIMATVKALLEEQMHHPPSLPVVQLVVGVVRGLSVAQVIGPEAGNVEEVIKLLQGLLRAGVEKGIVPWEDGKPGKPAKIKTAKTAKVAGKKGRAPQSS